MFKNLSIKFLALVLAIIFWFFVVSLENTFYRFPSEVPIQVFNQGQDLALASKLGGIHLSVRSSDPTVLRTLSVSDFEAYVDLRNFGAGTRNVEVLVTSKNPQVSVLKVDPSEIEVSLEPLKEKVATVKSEIVGSPLKGFKVDSVQLSKDRITISAAESVLAKIGQVKGEVQLDGTEDEKVLRTVTLKVFDTTGALLEGIKISEEKAIEATINIVELESRTEVGIKSKVVGSVINGIVKNIQIEPAVVSIIGNREVIEKVLYLETEPIYLQGASASLEKTVKVNLPQGVSLEPGQKNEIRVRVEIEKTN